MYARTSMGLYLLFNSSNRLYLSALQQNFCCRCSQKCKAKPEQTVKRSYELEYEYMLVGDQIDTKFEHQRAFMYFSTTKKTLLSAAEFLLPPQPKMRGNA